MAALLTFWDTLLNGRQPENDAISVQMSGGIWLPEVLPEACWLMDTAGFVVPMAPY